MRRKILSKVTVATLAAAMVFAQGIPAGAQVGNDTTTDPDNPVIQIEDETGAAQANANGFENQDLTFEGHVNKNIIKVVVPTITNDMMYNAILDPEGLIPATSVLTGEDADGNPQYSYFNYVTDDSRTPDQFGEPATMYFKNVVKNYDEETGAALDDTYVYSTVSDAMTITNKGTVPLDISLDVTLKDQANIEVNDSDEFDGNIASMYMAIADESGLTYVGTPETDTSGTDPVTVYKGNVKAYVPGADEGLYHINGATGDYVFEENKNEDGTALSLDNFGNYSFQITGGCNPNGIYSKDSAINVGKIDVVWTLHEAYSVNDTPVLATFEYEEPEDADGADLEKEFVYLYGDMQGTQISKNVAADATKDAYVFDADSVKIAGPGMDVADQVAVNAELFEFEDGDPAEVTGKAVKISRAAILTALTATCKDPDKADVIAGNYRIVYSVGGIEFVGVVNLPASAIE